jgi:hypothetical protein
MNHDSVCGTGSVEGRGIEAVKGADKRDRYG